MQTANKVSESFNEKEIREIIKKKAEERNCKIAAYIYMDEIIAIAKEYYNSKIDYFRSWFYTNPFNSYSEMCVEWAFESMKDKLVKVDKSSAEYQLYFELENHRDPEYNFENLNDYYDEIFKEDDRITEIMNTLSTEKIFSGSGRPAYTLHTIMQWLTTEQCKNIKDCILRLNACCDVEGIKSVLESANTNVSGVRTMLYEPAYKIISDADKVELVKSFMKRLQLITKYIEHVARTRDSHGRMFKDRYWISSTGSDPHSEGKHALFLVNKYDQEWSETDITKKADEVAKVYKPHDLAADNFVVGENGMLAKLNEMLDTNNTILKGEKPFATMSIDVDAHIEEFVIKKEEMTQEEAKKYFFRVGMLKVITDAMAVIDLHQDNIMPGSGNMPFIIDAEVDFFDYSSSGLESAITKDVYGGMTTGGITRPTNSTFKIAVDDKKLNSGESFMSTSSSKYREAYNDGYKFMLETIYNKLDVYADLYQSYLKSIPKESKIRIVPIETPQFAAYLQDAIVLLKSGDNDYLVERSRKTTKGSNRQEYASFVADKIEEKLTTNDELKSKPFIFRNEREKLKATVDKDKLTNSIKETFDNGTIIAMYCDMNGNIYLDNTVIGKILFNDKQINQEQLIEKMKNKFIEVINALYNKKLFDESGLSQIELDEV